MAKAKPKRNAEHIFDNEVLNADDAVASIIKKIKFEIDEDNITELLSACEWYCFDLNRFAPKNLVRRSNVIAALSALLEKGKSLGPLPGLLKMLKDLDPTTKSRILVDSRLSEHTNPEYLEHFEWDKLIFDLEILNETVSEYYNIMIKETDPGGVPKNIALNEFIKSLFPIYSQCTGKTSKRSYSKETRESYGEFPDFVDACVSPFKKTIKNLGHKIPSYSSICSSIQTALAEHNSKP